MLEPLGWPESASHLETPASLAQRVVGKAIATQRGLEPLEVLDLDAWHARRQHFLTDSGTEADA